MSKIYDLAVIGGGINGCGIARDAAGRGLSVLLCERGDLASATSSASTKLIHGGLRYLEQYTVRLVRDALREREVLLRLAPHIIWPLRFVLPHNPQLRPAWMIRVGLFIYDRLGGRQRLAVSQAIDLRADPAGKPLNSTWARGFEYSDCWVDDARLVVLNAMDAKERGANIRVRTELTGAQRCGSAWQLTLRDTRNGDESQAQARVVVNAAGPWVGEVLGKHFGLNTQAHVRLVKGSHIVVRRMFDHDKAYIFQNTDGRIVFAIPYETDFTLIGTTDVECNSATQGQSISAAETDYLCAAVNAYFKTPISPDDVVWSYSGVRPLYDDAESSAQNVTRDYTLERSDSDGAVLLSVFGGKITTYRHLSEDVLARLADCFPKAAPAWTASSKLPGGDFAADNFAGLLQSLSARYPKLPTTLLRRLARAYGTRTPSLLGDAVTVGDLGPCFGADLYGREVAYLIDNEFAETADDILWRRSKLGLRLTDEQASALATWLASSQN